MLTESDVRPQYDFEIENIVDGKCDIVFYDNIQEIDVEDEENKKKYEYNLYRLATNYRENLENDLKNDSTKLAEYKQMAINNEYNSLANAVREKRKKLLEETDWTQTLDTALSSEQKEKYRIYRQALRDITEQERFPYEVEWPEKPESGD